MKLIRKKKFKKKISVVGCGKLGLPLVAVLAEAGHEVIGFDLNATLIETLSSGKVPWFEESLQELLHKNRKRISFTSDPLNAFNECEFALVIVPSPSKESGEFDSKYVESAIMVVAGESQKNLVNKTKIVIVSTLMPGSTEEISSRLEREFGSQGSKFDLIYSPEFIALGSVVRDMTYPDLVLIGANNGESAREYADLVKSYIKSKPHFAFLNTKEAEIAKIAVNSYVTTKISFANFISELCDAGGSASASKVLASIGMDSRIGRKYLKPGAPFGGPCFPRDNIALEKYASEVGLHASIANATHSINQRQAERIASFLAKHITLKDVVLVGVAYKPGTAVTEESPTFAVANILKSNRNIALLDDYLGNEADFKLNQVMQRDLIGASPHCVVLMVPDPRYRDLPALLHKSSVIIDLWGDWESTATELGISYFRLGDSVGRK